MTLFSVKMLKPTGLERAHRMALGYSASLGRPPAFKAAGDRASLYVYDQIGVDWWTGEGVTAKSVATALEASKGKSLDIFINSPGGDIFEAKAIYEQLKRFAGEKVVYVDGIAASAASFIAMAGDRIVTSPAATWMIHEVWAIGAGNAADLRKLADLLEMESKTFAEVYARRTGADMADVQAWMAAETWMNAEQALERGFTDEISNADPAAAAHATEDLEALSNAVSTLRALRG